MKRNFITALLPVVYSLVALAPCASAQSESAVPSVAAITARMARARLENRALFRPYTVTREYKMFGKDREDVKSEVTADITFTPPDLKRYVIQRSSGSSLGGRVVKRMLEGEVAVAKNFTSTDISTDNYDFRFMGEKDAGGQRCYVLELLPRRADKSLVRGTVWVDTETYLLHRVEGSLAKNPSWWLKDVHVVFLYGDAGGMWLQTASEATANVRILGRATVVSTNVNTEVISAITRVASRTNRNN